MRRHHSLIIGAAAVLGAGGCTGPGGAAGDAQPTVRTRATDAASATIPQPTVTGLPVADVSERIDLRRPSFSHSTDITNPLFPVAGEASVLLLGEVEGQAFRTEVTVLPGSRVIDWDGMRVETVVSQYVAYLDSRIHEVAYDYYAQADDGSVWYFGEDVYNFAGGAIVDTHGTWLAGRDGPAAMIMPADPKVGDVYRPENIPGFVFEEVTVASVDQTLEGPLDPVEGGVLVRELHMAGDTEDKTFAPGYGEFLTSGGGDTEALALAVPTDAAPGSEPSELSALQDAALGSLKASQASDWTAAAIAAVGVNELWEQIVQRGEVPRLVEPRLRGAVKDLESAVQGRHQAAAGQLALDVAQAGLDLQLRYRPVTDVDRARFARWLDQLQVDARAGDQSSVTGDLFTLDYVRDRIIHTLDAAQLTRVNAGLEELQVMVDEDDLLAASAAAAELRDAVDAFGQKP